MIFSLLRFPSSFRKTWRVGRNIRMEDVDLRFFGTAKCFYCLGLVFKIVLSGETHVLWVGLRLFIDIV